MNPAADVFVPTNQISAGAGVDRRFLVSLQGTWQYQFFIGLFRYGMYDRDRRNSIPLRLFGERALVARVAEQRDDSGNERTIRATPTIISALRGGAGGISGGGWMLASWWRERSSIALISSSRSAWVP